MALMFFSVSIIWIEGSCIPTSVEVIKISSCTKPDSGIRPRANIFLVTKDTGSRFGTVTISHNIEVFFVTVKLQRSLRNNQSLPSVTAQRVGLLVDDNELGLIADLHTKINLGERRVPVGW